MIMITGLSVAFFLNTLVWFSQGLDNNLARTPPMGWMTWERFACETDCNRYPDTCISEHMIINQAKSFKDQGFLDAGYQYMIIDDCWIGKRDEKTQEIRAEPKRFPNGMEHVSKYLNNLGISFGIYLDFGSLTCGGYPGSEFHLNQDAQTLAKWNVSYVKMDGCYANAKDYEKGYETFSKFINTQDRSTVFSCSYPAYMNWEQGDPFSWTKLVENCNLWRMYYDITDDWGAVLGIIDLYKKQNDKLSRYGGIGHWNDPDMLMIGNFGLSRSQSFAQMGMWAIFAAPLIMSTDLTSIDPDMKSILLDKDLIGIDQDSLGVPGQFVKDQGKLSFWKRTLSLNRMAIAVLNSDTIGSSKRVTVSFRDFGIPEGKSFTVYNVKSKINETNQNSYEFNLFSSSLDLRIVHF